MSLNSILERSSKRTASLAVLLALNSCSGRILDDGELQTDAGVDSGTIDNECVPDYKLICKDGNVHEDDNCGNVILNKRCLEDEVCENGVCESIELIGPWSTTTPLPNAGKGGPLVAFNDNLYMVGLSIQGQSQSTQIDYAPILSDGKLGEWKQTTPFRIARNGHSAVEANGFLYVVAGSLGNSKSTATVHFAPFNQDNTIGGFSQTTTLPQYADNAGVVAHNDFMYVTGGAFKKWFDQVFYTTLAQNGDFGEWKSTTKLPYAVYGHGALVHDEHIYVMGGEKGAKTEVIAAEIKQDGSIDNWNATIPLPSGREYIDLMTYNGHVFVIGGMNNGPRADVFTAPLQAGGTVGDWSTTTPLPEPRGDAGVARYKEYVYVAGGYGPNGVTDTVFYAKLH